jgi:transketolase
LILSRQNLATIDNAATRDLQEVRRGAYTVASSSDAPRVVLIATGSEVGVALSARDILEKQGVSTNVVSAPCLEWFDEQPLEYRHSVLPPSAVRISVEAGISQGWWKYIGENGGCVAIDHFGASAAAPTLFEKFGITPEAVASVALERLA